MALQETEVLKHPLVSEKSTFAATENNTYTFEVDPRADKTEIKNAVEKLYNVKVTEVRTVNVAGKPRRTRTGYKTTGEWKKAIVKLHPDHKLDVV